MLRHKPQPSSPRGPTKALSSSWTSSCSRSEASRSKSSVRFSTSWAPFPAWRRLWCRRRPVMLTWSRSACRWRPTRPRVRQTGPNLPISQCHEVPYQWSYQSPWMSQPTTTTQQWQSKVVANRLETGFKPTTTGPTSTLSRKRPWLKIFQGRSVTTRWSFTRSLTSYKKPVQTSSNCSVNWNCLSLKCCENNLLLQ